MSIDESVNKILKKNALYAIIKDDGNNKFRYDFVKYSIDYANHVPDKELQYLLSTYNMIKKMRETYDKP